MNRRLVIILLIAILVSVFIGNISFGSVSIPFKSILQLIFSDLPIKSSWEYIIINYRLPKAIVAVLVGICLGVSGLLMQTLFRNPVAEPYILGISSGASLGVAILFLASSTLPLSLLTLVTSSYGVAIVSVLGSSVLLFMILLVSQRAANTVTILIVGLMFGSFTSAFISILSYFSSAEDLKRFSFWSMGSLGNLDYPSIVFFSIITLIGFLWSFALVRNLDALLLGDNYASSMGVRVKFVRNQIILITALLAGVCTAFVGPIAFIGLAVPHLSRLIFRTSSHKTLIFTSALLGAILLLICDSLSQVKGQSFILPINAITSVFGAPIVIWLLLGSRSKY
ncbi:iron chelate uptake ABC transporter family permease subunit [Myroides sp. LJL119]